MQTSITVGRVNVTLENASVRKIQLTAHAIAETIQETLYNYAARNGYPTPVVSDVFVRGVFVVIELAPESVRSRAQRNRILDPVMLGLYSNMVKRSVWGLKRFPSHSAQPSEGTWLVTSWLDLEEQRRLAALGATQPTVPIQPTIDVTADFDMNQIPEGQYVFPMGRRLDDGSDWFENLIDIIHLMAIGESGSGKSNWFKSVLLALTKRNTPAQLRVALASAKRSQFSMFSRLPHIWTSDAWDGHVATTAEDLDALTLALVEEFDRRDMEFERVGVDNLADYQRKTGRTFPRILFMADELLTISLMTSKGKRDEMMNHLASLLNTGRSHGFHLFLAITKSHFATVPTAITWNIDNRVSFRVATDQVSNDFECFGAHLIPKEAVGQFVARIYGKLAQARAYLVQSPDQESESEPTPMPPAVVLRPKRDDTDDRIRELAATGWSHRQIEREVFGYAGGKAHGKVLRALGATATEK